MSRTKKILFKIWQFISIFGLFIGLFFSFLGFLYGHWQAEMCLSEHKYLLNHILQTTRPTIKEIVAVFGEGWYYSSLSDKKKLEDCHFPKEVIEKFNRYPSMLFCGLPSAKYFIFFDREGRMVDFYVEGQ